MTSTAHRQDVAGCAAAGFAFGRPSGANVGKLGAGTQGHARVAVRTYNPKPTLEFDLGILEITYRLHEGTVLPPHSLPLDVQSRRRFRIRQQDFDNLSLLILGGVAIVNHLVSAHHDLDHVSASWAMNHDTPAKTKISDFLAIESEVIDAVGTVEQRDTSGFGFRIHLEPLGEEEREGDFFY